MTEIVKPNSHKYKREQKEKAEKKVEKRAEAVVTGGASLRKKSDARKLTERLVSEDVSSVKHYVVEDVLIPSLKDAFYNLITEGLNMLLFGGSGKSVKRTVGGGNNRTNYRAFSEDPRDRDRRHSGSRSFIEFDDVEFNNRGDAEYVLDQMFEILDNYSMVRVLDLYDLANIQNPPFTADRYGWTNLRSARVERLRGGKFIIRLPRAVQID